MSVVYTSCYAHCTIHQDTLRTLVQNSLQQFCDMIHDATYSTLELPEDFEWQGDLNQCAFK